MTVRIRAFALRAFLFFVSVHCAGTACGAERTSLVQVPPATASPQEVYAAWKGAFAQERLEVAWECMTPQMRDWMTAELFTLGELGGERGQAFVKEHVRADFEALVEKQREQRPNRPPTDAEFHEELLSTLKDKRAFFFAGFALISQEAKRAKEPAEAIPELKMVAQGAWARGSHLRNARSRENIDFVKTAAGWRIERVWDENIPDPTRATDYVKPERIEFVTPQAAFEAYVKARLAADWQTCWSCLTPRLQEAATYDALYDLSRHDPHFDKLYLLPDFKQPAPTLPPDEQRRLILAGIRDRFACYGAARDFQAGSSDDDWKEPLRNVVVDGDQAQGVVKRTKSGLRNDGRTVSSFYETMDAPVFFQKTPTGWLLDVAPLIGEKR